MTIKEYDAPLFVPPGHFYSPICDLNKIRSRKKVSDQILDINFNDEKQLSIFNALTPFLQKIPYADTHTDGFRYKFINGAYAHNDGCILYSMLQYLKPKQVIEIGSGNSSCIFLDALDQDYIQHLTCIEPYPELLYSLISDQDKTNPNVTILQSDVQDVPLETFEQLNAGDMLFIDSTHVVKTGSDVLYNFFEILPRLKPGVIIHIHDIFGQFEYPDAWVMNNWCWNELYLLRAFLMNNTKYEILFFNNYFLSKYTHLVELICPIMLKDWGSGIWLSKQ